MGIPVLTLECCQLVDGLQSKILERYQDFVPEVLQAVLYWENRRSVKIVHSSISLVFVHLSLVRVGSYCHWPLKWTLLVSVLLMCIHLL